jgi:4-amino-4-deoxy-L-arabinose transferase-like glycosyltransferase
MLKTLLGWIQKNTFEFLTLLLIITLGAFLRFYRIYDFAIFLGDEGRDALVVKRMIVDYKFTLLGPMTSIGNMYLGPIYYYFMIIPLWLFGLNPVGPAMMVATIGTMTILLVFFVGKDFFGSAAGLVSSLLYAVSPLIITHTRSSWNPNPMPFFATLTVYPVYKALVLRDGRWLMLAAASLGVALQLHYFGLLLIPIVFVLLLTARIKFPWRFYFWALISFLLVFSPIIIFEFRHQFVVSQAIWRFISDKKQTSFNIFSNLSVIWPTYKRLLVRLTCAQKILPGSFLAVLSAGILLGKLVRRFLKKGTASDLAYLTLFLWLAIGLFGTNFHQGDIHDHYLGFLFPTPFLILGFLASLAWSKKLGKGLVVATTLGLVVLNLLNTSPISGVGPNYQIERSKIVAKAIADDVGEEKFNVASISPTHEFRAMRYRYFLEIFGKIPQGYENYRDIETLYVIVEGNGTDPLKASNWEIQSFGPKEIVKTFKFDFQVEVFKLER